MSKSLLTTLIIILALPTACFLIAYSRAGASIIDSTDADLTSRQIKDGAMLKPILSSPSDPIGVNSGLIALTLRDQNGRLQISPSLPMVRTRSN